MLVRSPLSLARQVEARHNQGVLRYLPAYAFRCGCEAEVAYECEGYRMRVCLAATGYVSVWHACMMVYGYVSALMPDPSRAARRGAGGAAKGGTCAERENVEKETK